MYLRVSDITFQLALYLRRTKYHIPLNCVFIAYHIPLSLLLTCQ